MRGYAGLAKTLYILEVQHIIKTAQKLAAFFKSPTVYVSNINICTAKPPATA